MKKAVSLVLLSISIWSFSSIIIFEISRIASWHIYAIAFFFAAISFYFFAKKKHPGSFIHALGKLPRSYFFFGLFGYFFYDYSYIRSMQAFQSASEPTILNYTWILFTIIFTLFFQNYVLQQKKRISLQEISGLLIGFLSIWILATKGDITNVQFQNIEGLFWGIATGASYGLFSGFAGTLPKQDNELFLCCAAAGSALLMFLVALLDNPGGFFQFSFKEILLIIAIGLFINGLAYWSWTQANLIAHQQSLNISKIASLVFILPLSNVAVVSIYLKEAQIMESYFLFSLALMVCSVFVVQNSKSSQ